MSKEKFTESELSDIKYSMEIAWEAIGGDVLSMVEAETGNNKMSKDEVIEVVLDADRIDCYGILNFDIMKRFNEMEYKDKIKLAKEVFTFATYGM